MNEDKRRSYDSEEDFPHSATKTTSPKASSSYSINSKELSSPNKDKATESTIGRSKKQSIKLKKQYSKIYRFKTKILQNFGKADKTTDEVFDDYEINFNKQQQNANRLHKEVSNYLRCARALHGANKSLYECLAEVYEPEWVGHDLIYSQAQNSDMLWTDFCHKVQDQALTPLTAYVQEFPDIKKRIDKRGRKLVDYDSQRHQLESLQRSSRRDEYKIARSRDQLDNALKTYQNLNKELYDIMPSIYDQRIPQTSNCLRSLFSAETTFMQEASKISQELEAIADKLGREGCKGTYNSKRGIPPKDPKILSTPSNAYYEVEGEASQQKDEANAPSDNSLNEDVPKGKEGSYSLYPKIEDKPNKSQTNAEDYKSVELHAAEETLDEIPLTNGDLKSSGEETDESKELKPKERKNSEDDKNPFLSLNSAEEIAETPPKLPTLPPPYSESPPVVSTPPAANNDASAEQETNSNRPTISSPISHGKDESGRPYEEINFEDKVNGTRNATNGEISTTIPAGATTENLPQGVLYKVKAAYKYQQEDVDEISFEVGELIQVVEYDDPEEQEEGWLCGMKESTNEKGLFPANFTRPI